MDSSPGRNLSPQPKKGVHIHVKLPSGTEVHEFILPVGYTVDQVKRAIFKQIPDLASKETNPNDYQLKLRDNLRSKEEILNVEFSKLQNLDTVKSAADGETPLELSIMSTKPQGNHHQSQGPRGRPVSALHHGAGHDDNIHVSAPAHVYRTPTKDASEQTSPRRTSPATMTSPRRPSPSGAVSPRVTQLPQSATSPYTAPSQKAQVATAQPISPRSTSPRLTARSTSSPSLVPKSELSAATAPLSAVCETPSGTAGLSSHGLSQSTPVLPPSPTTGTGATGEVDSRDDSIKTLQDQLAQAHAKMGRLNARLARIGRLVRLELLPLSANAPLALNDDLSKRPARDIDIVASEKRLRATLGLVLAEIERVDDDSSSSPSKASTAQAPAPAGETAQGATSDTSVRALIGANQAGAALTTSTRELRVRSERTVSSADHDEAKRNRSLSSNAKKNSIDAIAGRMNLELPSGGLGSSVSSPSAIASGSASPPPDLSAGASPLPPRKILTPEERTEMLQQEFIDTEETYLRSLQKLHDHFEAPLIASGLLTPEQCDTLFSRVRTQLLEIHKHLLETIKNRPPGASFTDGLLVIAPYLKLYTEYVNNHPEAISLLIELNANSKKFAALLKQIETKPEVDSQDLSSYLIRPIQRLPRYELLLRDMVKYTTEETEHLKLSRLLEAVKKVNEHLNEAKRKRDNSTKMAAIQSNLILGKAKGFSLFSSQTRTFLRDDTLLVKKVKKEKTTFTRHHFFLFTDLLLDTVKTREGKYKLTRVYPLAETSFMKYEGESDTVALFQTSSSESAVEDLTQAIHVKADQGGDIDGWLQETLKAKANQRVDESREGRYHVVL